MILGASFLMRKGVQLALHRAPPGVHGRKEARGWVAGGREEEESKQGSKRRNTELQKEVDIFIVWTGSFQHIWARS